MELIEIIRSRLATLDPVRLEITDDSHRHAGHAGAQAGGGHFEVHVVSDAFSGQNTLARHRRIHALLADLMPSRIHALAISARTREESGS